MDVQLACDYIITKMEGAGTTLSVLKLLKLLYFSQQWHLTFYGDLLFEGRFQAWDQGPVSREIYDRFVGCRSLYSEVSAADVSRDFAVASLACEKRSHLDHVLDAYAKCKDSALDEMIRYDEPWLEARRGFAERCENEINEDHMRRFCMLLYLLKQFGTGGVTCAQRQTFQVPAGPRESERVFDEILV
jgi:uncharacterized phage-associated protein